MVQTVTIAIPNLQFNAIAREEGDTWKLEDLRARSARANRLGNVSSCSRPCAFASIAYTLILDPNGDLSDSKQLKCNQFVISGWIF